MSKTFAPGKKQPLGEQLTTPEAEPASPALPAPLPVVGDRAVPQGVPAAPSIVRRLRPSDAGGPGRPRSNDVTGPAPGIIGRPRGTHVTGPAPGPATRPRSNGHPAPAPPRAAVPQPALTPAPPAPVGLNSNYDGPQDEGPAEPAGLNSNYNGPQDQGPAAPVGLNSNYGGAQDEGPATPEHVAPAPPPTPAAAELAQEVRKRVESTAERPAADQAEAAPQKPLEDLPEIRKHRAWLVAKVAKKFQSETTVQTPEVGSKIEEFASVIGILHGLLSSLPELDPSDDVSRTALLALLPKEHPTRKATTHAAALASARANYVLNLETARREDLPIQENGALGPIGDRLVDYDEDGAAQERTVVKVGAGKLWRNDEAKSPVDTTDSVTHHTGPGAEIFVVGLGGDIHMASHRIGKFHHSSLLGGKPVAMAGEIKATQGKINWISNKSGHYLPTVLQLQQFLHHLGKDVPLDFPIREMGALSVPDGTLAQDFVEGRSSTGRADKVQGHDHRKSQALIPVWIELITPAGVEEVMEANGWVLTPPGRHWRVTKKGTKDVVPGKDVRQALKAAHPDKRPVIGDEEM